jgi:hypothetical protein
MPGPKITRRAVLKASTALALSATATPRALGRSASQRHHGRDSGQGCIEAALITGD